MAQIQEYLPEVEAQGAVGGVSPNVELAGAAGRGLEQVGNAVVQGADAIYRKQSQEETADVYSQIADKRSQYTQQIQEQIQDGSLDTEKFKDQFDEDTQKIGENLQTAEGRNFFTRQQARLKGTMLTMAAHGQAQVAKNEAIDSWQRGMNATSSSLMRDPNQFMDSYHAGLESIDELIKNGGLPEAMRGKAERAMGLEYAKGAIRGFADPGGLNSPEAAKRMINSGAYDQYMNSDQKREMLHEVDGYANRLDIEGARADRAEERAQKLRGEKWGADNFQKLVDGTMKPDEVSKAVRAGTLTPEKGEHYLNAIDAASRKELKTNPEVYSSILRDIADPDSKTPITSSGDPRILQAIANGDLAVEGQNSASTLMKAMSMTPAGSYVKRGEKQLFDISKSSGVIRFKNQMSGGSDANGVVNANTFMDDYYAKKAEVMAAGGSVQDLITEWKSAENIAKYSTPYSQQFQQQADGRKQKALAPTDGTPPPANAIKPNESAADFLKRVPPPKRTVQADEPPTPTPAPDIAPAKTADQLHHDNAADDTKYLTDQLGLTGPKKEAREKEQAERRRKNREAFR